MIANKLMFLFFFVFNLGFNVLENSIYLQDMHFPNKFSLVMKTSRGLLRIPKGPPFGQISA